MQPSVLLILSFQSVASSWIECVELYLVYGFRVVGFLVRTFVAQFYHPRIDRAGLAWMLVVGWKHKM